MASGRLGAVTLATANTTIYGPSAATSYAVVSVSICNSNGSSVTVRLAISTTATPGVNDYIEYGVTIPANATLERTGLVLSNGNYLVGYSSNASGVSAVAYGIEN